MIFGDLQSGQRFKWQDTTSSVYGGKSFIKITPLIQDFANGIDLNTGEWKVFAFDDKVETVEEKFADEFYEVAMSLSITRGKLEHLSRHLKNDIDQRAAKRILTDLAWAIENCTVIGLHQEGKALDDTMGLTEKKDA